MNFPQFPAKRTRASFVVVNLLPEKKSVAFLFSPAKYYTTRFQIFGLPQRTVQCSLGRRCRTHFQIH